MHKRLVIAAIALGVIACRGRESTEPYGGQDDRSVRDDEVAPPPEEDEEQSVGEVVKDPQYGERVTVEGKVDQVLGDRVFTMKARLFQDDLLVVAPESLTYEALEAPAEIEVVGEVRKMVVSEAEREFSVTFDNAVKVKWEDRPYLVAESVRRKPKDE